jgi:hypothetical protein
MSVIHNHTIPYGKNISQHIFASILRIQLRIGKIDQVSLQSINESVYVFVRLALLCVHVATTHPTRFDLIGFSPVLAHSCIQSTAMLSWNGLRSISRRYAALLSNGSRNQLAVPVGRLFGARRFASRSNAGDDAASPFSFISSSPSSSSSSSSSVFSSVNSMHSKVRKNALVDATNLQIFHASLFRFCWFF